MSLAPHSDAIDCAWLLAEPGLRPAQAGMRIEFDGERFGAIEIGRASCRERV